MPIDFNQVWNTLISGVKDIATKEATGFVNEAKQDGLDLLNTMKDDLATWTQQLASGAIDKGAFGRMVATAKDTLAIDALVQKGIAKVSIDKFRNAVSTLIINTITGLIP